MAFWQRAYEGEVFIDHRASPGLPEHIARLCGYDPAQCGEGRLFEAATLSCSHCRQRLIKNPLRTRERATCLPCANHYICDLCDAERRKPGYVHTPFEAVIERVIEGKTPWQNESSRPASPTPPPLLLAP